jgi:acetyl-CoA C-acetyltransferase
MKKVYIISACRTAIGKMGGALSSMSAIELGSAVIREAVRRACVEPESVDHVYLGCVLQAGLGQNVARQSAIMAGLPFSTTAETLNIVCGSGLDAVNSAARMISSGEADIVIAGGTESMSNAPFALNHARFGYRMGYPMRQSDLVDLMVNDGLWDSVNDYHMGITAENIAERWQISREESDEYSAASQMKACTAIENGAFKDEIIPVTVKDKKREIIFDTDEEPRKGITPEQLAGLKPAFRKNGTVTAGNSSSIDDGAAAVLLASEEAVKKYGLEPLAEWIGGALGGVDPAIMGIGSVKSTDRLLRNLNMTIGDFELIEANEAFAAQSIAVKRELGIPSEKLNIHGGAIALGHPIGASGCRILVALLYELIHEKKTLGLATLCIGGGMGCSTAVKRIEKENM